MDRKDQNINYKDSNCLKPHKGIMVYIEIDQGRLEDTGLELLSKAHLLNQKLGGRVYAVLIGSVQKEEIKKVFSYGADKALVVDHPMVIHTLDDVYSQILASVVRKRRPEIFLAAATPAGKTIIPRLAAILKTGLSADCTQLEVGRETTILEQTKPTFGGDIMATIVCEKARPQMATVRPHVFKKNKIEKPREIDIEYLDMDTDLYGSKYHFIEADCSQVQDIDLSSYEVIIAGGRGMGSKENFSLLQQLAGLMGGGVAATRAAVDAGWISSACQIGQTGQTVSPRLYIACGISGAIQHLAGIQNSDIIVAINKDRQAPIFNMATYGIVGDVMEILPRLIYKIKEHRGLVD